MTYENTINPPQTDEQAVDGTQQAYEKYEPEMRALRSDDKERITVDPDLAVRRALVAVRRLTPYASVLEQLPDRKAGDLDKLRGLALATLYTHKGLGRKQAKRRLVRTLTDRGYTTRAKLTSLVKVLIGAGILSPTLIDELVGGRAYTDLANDLRVLAKALQRKWSEIGDSVYLKKGDVEAAETLSDQIYSETVKRAAGESANEDYGVDDMRRRAFTLLKRLFTSIRKSAVYLLQSTHDVDELIPPLAARSKRPPRAVAIGDADAGDAAGVDDGDGDSIAERAPELGAATEVAEAGEEDASGSPTRSAPARHHLP